MLYLTHDEIGNIRNSEVGVSVFAVVMFYVLHKLAMLFKILLHKQLILYLPSQLKVEN